MHETIGISKPHAFLFRKLNDGTVGMKVKAFHSTTDPWEGGDTETDEWYHVMRQFPEGFPDELPLGDMELFPPQKTMEVYVKNKYLTARQIKEYEYIQEHHCVPQELLYTPVNDIEDPDGVNLAFF